MVKILIADDEEPARNLLRTYLADIPDIAIVGEAEDGKEAVRLATMLQPDIVLLDVQMPGLDGISAAAALPQKILVIFVTAYDSYAIQAFELHAFDYILKPVMRDRLESAIAQARQRLDAVTERTNVDTGDLGALLDLFKARQSYATRLTIKNTFEYLVLNTEEISCIRVENGLVFVYSKGIKYMIDTPLKKLEQRLDPEIFIRLHRNAIVNKSMVKKMYPWKKGQYFVETEGGEKVAVSRDHLAHFKLEMGWTD